MDENRPCHGRAQASPNDRKTRSIRAGIDQAEASEGARAGSAARAVKCHVRATSGGGTIRSDTPTGGGSETVGTVREMKQRRHAKSAGGRMVAVSAADLNAPVSTTSHASRGVSRWSSERQPSVQENALSRPAASNAQCIVAGSHRASRAKAMMRRTRNTTGTRAGSAALSTHEPGGQPFKIVTFQKVRRKAG